MIRPNQPSNKSPTEKRTSEALLEAFEQAWISDRDHPPVINDFLDSDADRNDICELIKIDMEFRWRSRKEADRRTIENYLEQFPDLNSPDWIIELIEETTWLQLNSDQTPDASAWKTRFPTVAEVVDESIEWVRSKWQREYGAMLPTGEDSTLGPQVIRTKVEDSSNSPTTNRLPLELPGYEVLEELGRGGMARVFKAKQTALNRLVAIKVPYESSSEATNLRIEKEAKAAAQIKHPNIVEVIEVGRTADQAYLVMQFVDGGSLDGLIAGKPLCPRVAARLFQGLVKGIQVAHKHKVVHRDLKPSNILLEPMADSTEEWTPKIADFGLARWSEDPTLTKTGVLVGTPSYMAPEQTHGDRERIGNSVDIYALGATLYHMLTGRPPFVGSTSLETMQQIQSDEPIAPGKLNRETPRELEAICLRCLEKSPAHRYATATELLGDIDNFLGNRPVAARPAGWLRRTSKWCRRHPTAATMVTAAALMLLSALAGVSIHNYQLQSALADVEKEKLRADENFDDAFQAVNQMLDETGFVSLMDVPEMDGVREKLATRAIQYYEDLLKRTPNPKPHQWQIYQTAQARRAQIYLALGKFQESADFFQQAIDLQRRIVERDPSSHARSELAVCLINRSMAAGASSQFELQLESLNEALAVLAELDNDETVRRNLAKAHNERGNFFHGNGDLNQAEKDHKDARSIREELAKTYPDDTGLQTELGHSRFNLASVWFHMGLVAEANDVLQECEELWRSLLAEEPNNWQYIREIATCLETRNSVYHQLGRTDDAEACIKETLQYRTKLFENFPHTVGYRNGVAMAYHNLGDLYLGTHRMELAKEALQNAIDWRQPLIDQTDEILYSVSIAEDQSNLGIVLHALGSKDEAKDLFLASLANSESILSASPDLPRHIMAVTSCRTNYGNLLRDLNQHDAAIEQLSQAVDALTDLYERDRANAEVRNFLLNAHGSRANTYAVMQDYKNSLIDCDKVVEFSSGPQKTLFHAWRLPTTARVDPLRMETEIAELLQMHGITGEMRYNIACAYSIAAARSESEETAAAYIDKAFEILTDDNLRAFLQPQNMQEHLKTDADLEMLRMDDRFQRILDSLKAEVEDEDSQVN